MIKHHHNISTRQSMSSLVVAICIIIGILLLTAVNASTLDEMPSGIDFTPPYLNYEKGKIKIKYTPLSEDLGHNDKIKLRPKDDEHIYIVFPENVYSNAIPHEEVLYRNRNIKCQYHVNKNSWAQFKKCEFDFDPIIGAVIECELNDNAHLDLKIDNDIFHMECSNLFTPSTLKVDNNNIDTSSFGFILMKDTIPGVNDQSSPPIPIAEHTLPLVQSLISNPDTTKVLVTPIENSDEVIEEFLANRDKERKKRALEYTNKNTNLNNNIITKPPRSFWVVSIASLIPQDGQQNISKNELRAICAHFEGLLHHDLPGFKCKEVDTAIDTTSSIVIFGISSKDNLLKDKNYIKQHKEEFDPHQPLLNVEYLRDKLVNHKNNNLSTLRFIKDLLGHQPSSIIIHDNPIIEGQE